MKGIYPANSFHWFFSGEKNKAIPKTVRLLGTTLSLSKIKEQINDYITPLISPPVLHTGDTP